MSGLLKKAIIATKEGSEKYVARETPYLGHSGEAYRDILALDEISDTQATSQGDLSDSPRSRGRGGCWATHSPTCNAGVN